MAAAPSFKQLSLQISFLLTAFAIMSSSPMSTCVVDAALGRRPYMNYRSQTALDIGDRKLAAQGLAERLQQGGGGMVECWDSLVQLRSCAGEVILFFLNGQTYLGPACCRAVRGIERSCWAADAMLAALGFTPDEGDLLRGFCDAAPPPDAASPPPPPQVAGSTGSGVPAN